MDFLREDYEDFPTRPLDLFNMVATPAGYASGPGWAILGNEITSSTNGKVNSIVGFPTTAESNYTVALCGKRALNLSGGSWSSIQDGNDFTIGDNDHIDTAIFNDTLVLAIPKTGTANALRTWAGTGNIAAMSGSPRNARWAEWLGERLLTAGTFSGAGVYDATKIYRSAQNSITSHPGDFTDMTASPSPIMKILRIGQMLVVYKQNAIAVLHVTGDDLLPFEPDEIPGNLGLALPEAVAAGGQYHCFMAPNNFFLFDGISAPMPIGDPVQSLIYDNLAAGSYMLAGYDNKSPQREAFLFWSNFALAADAVGPNSAASTNTYWQFDVTTKSWSRGDAGSNVPRAAGNYFPRFGFRDDAPISQQAGLVGLESTNGSSVYELSYSQSQRISANFTRRLLLRPFHCGMPFQDKSISQVFIEHRKKSTGTLTLSVKAADGMGEKPSERVSLSFSMTGTASGASRVTPLPVNVTGRILQLEITSTADVEINNIWLEWGPRG